MKYLSMLLFSFALFADNNYPANPLKSTTEIKNFCQKIQLESTNNVGMSQEELSKILQEAKPYEQQIICPECRNWSWLLITYPHELIRRDALYWGLLRSGNPRDVHELTLIEKNLNYDLKTFKLKNGVKDDYLVRAQSIMYQYKNISNTTGDSNSIGSLLPKIKKMVSPYCLTNHPFEKKNCRHAFDYILTYGIPKYELFFPDLMQEILVNEDIYYNPLRRYSLKLIEYLKDFNKKVEGSMFADLVQEFLKEGHTRSAAIEYSIKTLGLLSIAGGETGNRLLHVLGTYEERDNPEDGWYYPKRRKRYALSLSLNLISMIPTMLDIRAQSQGKSLYTIPRNYNFDCQNGKTYYFWMSAYMSWKLVQRNKKISKKLATKIPLILQSAYQFLGNNFGRKRYRSVTVPTFDLFNNKIRRDTLHATAGSLYGYHLARSNYEHPSYINFNRLFVDYFQRADKFEKLIPLKEVKKPGLRELNRFNKVIKPYFLLKAYK